MGINAGGMKESECFRKCDTGIQALMMDWFPCICACSLKVSEECPSEASRTRM